MDLNLYLAPHPDTPGNVITYFLKQVPIEDNITTLVISIKAKCLAPRWSKIQPIALVRTCWVKGNSCVVALAKGALQTNNS